MPPGKQQCPKKEFLTVPFSPLHGRFPFFSKRVGKIFASALTFSPFEAIISVRVASP